MSVNVRYRTTARATGGRTGHSATLDGALDVQLSRPKELGGVGGSGVNPEQLFAVGYAACFLSAMQFVASQGGPRFRLMRLSRVLSALGPVRGRLWSGDRIGSLRAGP